MIQTCEPLPQSVAEEMLQVVARAICDRPGESPLQRDSRTRQMVHSTLGMRPRDGLEYMLSTLVVGHYNLLLHSMHEVFQGQADTMSARPKSTIVALGRAMIGMVKELRTERKRPLAKWTGSVAVEADVEAAQAGSGAANQTATDEAARRTGPQPEPTVASAATDDAARRTGGLREPAAAGTAATGRTGTSPGPTAADFMAEMALALREAAEREKAGAEKPCAPVAQQLHGTTSASTANTREMDGTIAAGAPGPMRHRAGGTVTPMRPLVEPPGVIGVSRRDDKRKYMADGGLGDEHQTVFEQALANVVETLDVAGAFDAVKAGTKVMTGD